MFLWVLIGILTTVAGRTLTNDQDGETIAKVVRDTENTDDTPDTKEEQVCKDCEEGDMMIKNSLWSHGVTKITDPSTNTTTVLMHGAQLLRDYQWPNATLVYELDSSLSDRTKKAAIAAMNHLKKHTCLKFREKTSSDRDFVFFQEEPGCWAYVGRVGGRQPINYGLGCHSLGTSVHEMIHTLGFFHEQSRNDRDEYIDIDLEHVKTNYHRNFKKYSLAEIDHLGIKYDYDSVMHYPKTAFTRGGKISIQPKVPGVIIGQRNGVSSRDIDKVNAYYKCPLQSPPCVDKYVKCGSWAKQGDCHTEPEFMFRRCPYSCGGCKFFEGCEDRSTDCVEQVKDPQACKFRDIKRNCRASCHACLEDFVKGLCVDKDVIECPILKQMGHCSKRPSYMKDKCKKSCNFCNSAIIPGTDTSGNDPYKEAGLTICDAAQPDGQKCELWKSLGRCEHGVFQQATQLACPRTCGVCHEAEVTSPEEIAKITKELKEKYAN